MGKYEDVISCLQQHNIAFQEIHHKPVYTSEEARKVRHTLSPYAGAKSLLVKYQEDFALLVLPGICRLDNLSVRKLLNVKKFRFATSEEVEKIVGVKIGAVFPMSWLFNQKVPMYADINAFEKTDKIAINPGKHDITLIMRKQDFLDTFSSYYQIAKLAKCSS